MTGIKNLINVSINYNYIFVNVYIVCIHRFIFAYI